MTEYSFKDVVVSIGDIVLTGADPARITVDSDGAMVVAVPEKSGVGTITKYEPEEETDE